ncbi:MAG: hypothetical protein HOY79_15925 [Streptomyces sp.]|nr:hypothetical protein [Streptomyces sp.]
MSDWVEERIARVMETSRALGEPPLPPRLKFVAAQLAKPGPSALGIRRRRVRRIGRRLHRAGGVPLMRAVLHQAEILSLRLHSVTVLRDIEREWDGIGDWQN